MCFITMAMLLASGSSWWKSWSSLICAMAPSARRLCPRRLRRASSRYADAMSALILNSFTAETRRHRENHFIQHFRKNKTEIPRLARLLLALARDDKLESQDALKRDD